MPLLFGVDQYQSVLYGHRRPCRADAPRLLITVLVVPNSFAPSEAEEYWVNNNSDQTVT